MVTQKEIDELGREITDAYNLLGMIHPSEATRRLKNLLSRTKQLVNRAAEEENVEKCTTEKKVSARIIGVKGVDQNQNRRFNGYSALIRWIHAHGRSWYIEFETAKGRRILGADVRIVKAARTK
jgi:hypothetical protein